MESSCGQVHRAGTFHSGRLKSQGKPLSSSQHCALGKHKIGVYPTGCQANMSSFPRFSNPVYILLTILHKF